MWASSKREDLREVQEDSEEVQETLGDVVHPGKEIKLRILIEGKEDSQRSRKSLIAQIRKQSGVTEPGSSLEGSWKEPAVDMGILIRNFCSLLSVLASKAPARHGMLTGSHWFFTLL
jgi:hypothetical protein